MAYDPIAQNTWALMNERPISLDNFDFSRSPLDEELFKQIVSKKATYLEAKHYRERISDWMCASAMNKAHPDWEKLNTHYTIVGTLLDATDGKERSYIPPGSPAKVHFLIKKLDELIDKDLPDSEAHAILNYLADENEIRPYEIKALYEKRKEELANDGLEKEIDQELTHLLAIANEDINIAHFLPPEALAPIQAYCENSQVKGSIALATLLTGISICSKVGTKVLVDGSKNWTEPTNLFTLIVSPTGQGKSPILKALILDPMWEIQKDYFTNWEFDKEEEARYNAKLKLMSKEERLEALERDDAPNAPDRPKILFANDLTMIGVNLQFQHYPEQGILGLYDEGTKLFKFNRFSGGAGSEREDLLSYYNGQGVVELRKEGVRTSVGETLFSVYGTIQPENLLQLMSGCDDPSGQWARFLFPIQPLQKKVPTRDQARVEISPYLTALYQKILARPKQFLLFSREAGDCFDNYLYRGVEEERVKTTNPGMAAVLGKVGGKLARIAANLHILKQVCAGTDENLISGDTLAQAMLLTDFFTNQTRILHAQSQALQGEVPPMLAQIIQKARQRGSISARDLQSADRAFRDKSADEIRAMFKQLTELKKGTTEGRGNRMRFTAFPGEESVF